MILRNSCKKLKTGWLNLRINNLSYTEGVPETVTFGFTLNSNFMALSLDAIYKPINDFFVHQFQMPPGSPVYFRFDKFGTSFSDADFTDPRVPGVLSEAMAREKFSDLVNSVPLQDSDDEYLVFTENNIDHIYRDQLLGPAVVCIPEDATAEVRESISSTFSQIKADAIRLYESIQLASSSGIMLDYKPSLATPQQWFDRGAPVWSQHSFQATETNHTPAVGGSTNKLWRLKVTDNVLQKILPVEDPHRIDLDDLHRRILIKRGGVIDPHNPVEVLNPGLHDRIRPALTRAMEHADVGTLARQPLGAAVIEGEGLHTNVEGRATPEGQAKTFAIGDALRQKLGDLDFRKRITLDRFIKTNAPQQETTTSSVTVTFDYCFVRISRPWWSDSFISNAFWFLPGIEKGEQNKNPGSLQALPIGFLIIKNLFIEANWSQLDLEASKMATDFGPFEVSFEKTTNRLEHAGIQVIGWVLQALPPLPPNNVQF